MKLSAFLVALFLLHQSSALAQERATDELMKTSASEHAKRGNELYKQQAYSAALLEFQRAYVIAPDARLLYSIGQAQVALKHYADAARSYERYIAQAQRDGAPVGRNEAAQMRDSTRPDAPRVSVTITMHQLDLSASTLKRLEQLTELDDGRALEIVLEGIADKLQTPSAPSGDETVAQLSEPVRETLPQPTAEFAPQATAGADLPVIKSRIARGIDAADPYGAR